MFNRVILLVLITLICSCGSDTPVTPEEIPEIDDGIVTDIDGNVYQTVKIGDQVWMAENLKVTRYSNGDSIPEITDSTEWFSRTGGAYCVYMDADINADVYGHLYNWFALNDSRGIAPEGWHVPTLWDWSELEMYLGVLIENLDGTGYYGTDEGGKLKADSALWHSPNEGATNESGFSALPGGGRFSSLGYFSQMGYMACFWTATEVVDPDFAYSRTLRHDRSDIVHCVSNKRLGHSVRLVKNK